MSKTDELRAMRDAKYARARAATGRAPLTPNAPSKPAKTTAPVAPPATPAAGGEVGTATDELCGHRNMSGRTCTREQGHAAKSHRYS